MYFTSVIRFSPEHGRELPYYKIKESFRDVLGRVHTRAMLTPGYLPDIEGNEISEIRRGLTYKMEQSGNLPGQARLFDADPCAGSSRKVRDYVSKFWQQMLDNGKIDAARDSYDEAERKARRLVDVDTIKHTDAREVGAESVCLQAIRELQLDTFLRHEGWTERKINATLASLIVRTVYSPSEWKALRILDENSAAMELLKSVYAEDDEFVELTQKLGKIRLQYHLTDIALLLPPNMRAIARFMNLSDWVEWGNRMPGAMDSLEPKAKDVFSFLTEYSALLEELGVCIDAIRHVETTCKTSGFNLETCRECSHYVVRNVIGNANNRRASLGLRILDYPKKEARLLHLTSKGQNISSDIIESDFGFPKSKMSPNKLYGFTSQVLMLPLYPKTIDYSVANKQDFKVRLTNVKLREIDD